MFKSMLKRSWLSIIRKPSRSIILGLILFVMANMLLATVSIKNSVDESTQFAKEKISGTVYLQQDMEKMRQEMTSAQDKDEGLKMERPIVSQSLADDIVKSDYVKDYSYSINASANADGFEAVETAQNKRERAFRDSFNSAKEQNQNQGSGMQGGTGMPPADIPNPILDRGDISVLGINSYNFISDVENGSMEIAEGEAFDENTTDGVIISDELAEANSLKVGGTLTLKTVSDEKQVSFKVVGIYSSTAEEFDYNTIYANIDSTKKLLSSDEQNSLSLQNVRYYLTSAENKDAFISEVNQKHPDLADKKLKIDVDDTAYQTMVGPIESVGSFSVTIMWVVVIAAVVIITLIVVNNVKDRRYEMGVLMSLGAKRRSILGQVFIELIVVGTVAFSLSLVSGQVIAQKMGKSLLNQQIASSKETSQQETAPGMGRGQFAGGPGNPMRGGRAQSNVERIDKIDVSAGIQEYATIFGIGYLVIILAMIVPSINVFRYQPKTILSGKE